MVRLSYLDSYLHALRVALSLFIEYLHNQKYVPLAMTHAHKGIDVRHIYKYIQIYLESRLTAVESGLARQ